MAAIQKSIRYLLTSLKTIKSAGCQSRVADKPMSRVPNRPGKPPSWELPPYNGIAVGPAEPTTPRLYPGHSLLQRLVPGPRLPHMALRFPHGQMGSRVAAAPKLHDLISREASVLGRKRPGRATQPGPGDWTWRTSRPRSSLVRFDADPLIISAPTSPEPCAPVSRRMESPRAPAIGGRPHIRR